MKRKVSNLSHHRKNEDPRNKRKTLRRWVARQANCDPDKLEYLFCGYRGACSSKILKAMTTDVFKAYVLCTNTDGCNCKSWVRVIVKNMEAYR